MNLHIISLSPTSYQLLAQNALRFLCSPKSTVYLALKGIQVKLQSHTNIAVSIYIVHTLLRLIVNSLHYINKNKISRAGLNSGGM